MVKIAARIAIVAFFIMSAIGLAVHQPPFTCTLRALMGSIGVFIAAWMALRVALNVMIQSVVENAPPPKPDDDEDELAEPSAAAGETP